MSNEGGDSVNLYKVFSAFDALEKALIEAGGNRPVLQTCSSSIVGCEKFITEFDKGKVK